MGNARKYLGRWISAAAFATILSIQPAYAADFAGKTIEIIIPGDVGGGSDVWARFYAGPFAENLPGKPNVVVQNRPGGGAITGVNFFHSRAKPDGLMLLGTAGSANMAYYLGDPRVAFDYKDHIAVLVSPVGGVVYVNPELGVTGLDNISELKNKELVFTGTAPNGVDMVPLVAFELLGLKVRAVFGTTSRGEARLAFERGEVNIDFQTSPAYLTNVQPLVDEGKAIPLFAFGVVNAQGDIERDPTFPDIPHFGEAYKAATGDEPSGEVYEAWKGLLVASFSSQKIFFLPKDTPADIVEAYSKAAQAIVTAPGFAERAQAVIGDYKQLVGPDAIGAAQNLSNISPSSRDWARQWLVDRFDVKL